MLRNIGSRLSPPAGLVASSDQSDGVYLSWNHRTYTIPYEVPTPPGSIGPLNAIYSVFRSNNPNANPPEIELTSEWQTSNSFVDNTALPGATYYYSVKAAATISEARESDFSIYAQGYRTFNPLETPTGVSASDGLEGLIYIHWNSVPNANFYKVFRANSIGGTKTELGNWQTQLSIVDVPESPDTLYYYWVKAAIDSSGGRESDFGGPDSGYYIVGTPTPVDSVIVPLIPEVFLLSQSYPNPFNAQATIKFALPEASHVNIKIYDLLGRNIETLVDDEMPAGYHQATWNANDVSTGIYFYRIQAGDYSETKKMVLLK